LLSLLAVEADLPEECEDLTSMDPGEDLPIFAVATMPWEFAVPTGFRNERLMSVARTRDFAFVDVPWAGEQYWFDRRRDPGETRPLVSPPPGAMPLQDALDDWMADAEDTEGEVNDPRLKEALRSIGYLD
jgi:hypothetical protein